MRSIAAGCSSGWAVQLDCRLLYLLHFFRISSSFFPTSSNVFNPIFRILVKEEEKKKCLVEECVFFVFFFKRTTEETTRLYVAVSHIQSGCGANLFRFVGNRQNEVEKKRIIFNIFLGKISPHIETKKFKWEKTQTPLFLFSGISKKGFDLILPNDEIQSAPRLRIFVYL